MSAPTIDKTSAQTISASSFFAAYLRAKNIERLRNIGSLLFFVGACALWLAGLGRMGLSIEVLPWFSVLVLLSVFSVRFLRQESLPLHLHGVPRSREPLQLRESLSVSSLAIAIALYAWIAFSLMHPFVSRVRTQQVVDIQLLSERDYINNNEQLPGSEEKDELRKRSSDTVSQMGELNHAKVQQPRNRAVSENSRAKRSESRRVNSKGLSKLQPEEECPSPEATAPSRVERVFEQSDLPSIVVPSGWKTSTLDRHLRKAARVSSALSQADMNEPYITELSPPELVELVDNDGDPDAMHVFQKGGKSEGGKGAANGLFNYLKELHKRIKNAWNPPPGNAGRVQLLFRLKRDGRLAFVRVSRSSGDSETDNSAVRAVMEAALKGKPLPADYTPDFLDLSYKFNYSVDELQELKNPEKP